MTLVRDAVRSRSTRGQALLTDDNASLPSIHSVVIKLVRCGSVLDGKTSTSKKLLSPALDMNTVIDDVAFCTAWA